MDRINLPSYYTNEDKKVVKLFKEEMDRINLLYLKAVKENDFTKANRLLWKLKNLVRTLVAEYWERAEAKIPKEYLKGAWYIQGIKINDNLSQSEVMWMIWELWPIHIEAVYALLDNSRNYVKSSLDWVERQALSMLTEFHQAQVREQLAKGIISGESWYTMNQRIKDYLLENEITTFKDRWGKTWTMDRYIDMLVRTETSIANVQGVINRALELWITKFRIIERPDCCKECSHLHWTIVDIRDWTVELPPFHPNCRGYIIAVDDYFEEISPRKDEPWKTLWISEDTYNYLKDDLDKVKERRNWNYPIWMVDEAIVRNYTGASYENMNKWIPPEVADRMDKIIQYHPWKSQTVYRGMTFTQSERNKYLESWEIYHKWFMSTSTDKDRAKLFSKKNIDWDRNIKVIIEIKAKWWMDIHNYSVAPKQKEVIFSRWKNLKIDSSSLNSQWQYLFIKWKING